MSSNVLAFAFKGAIPVDKEEQNAEPKTRSIILPVYFWDLIEGDAKRCRRSINKQIEAVFAVYYGVESSVNIDEEGLALTSATKKHKPPLKKTA